MSAPLSEFVFESVIRDGLGDLRSTPSKLDDIFSRFKEAFLDVQYGQSKIDEIKTYIVENQIRIVHSFPMAPMSTPCISIQLMRASEDPMLQNIGNEFEEVDASKTPDILVPIVTPGTYDTLTGKLTVTNAADLSLICPGLVFVDFSGTPFTIESGNSNTASNKFINIGKGKDPDLGGDGRIESSIDITRTERRMIRLSEGIDLGCHVKDDVHLAKLLYYILTYILKSRQESLITRGITLDYGNAGVHDREQVMNNENVFSRYISVNCLTQFDWNQEEVNLIDCFDTDLKATQPGGPVVPLSDD